MRILLFLLCTTWAWAQPVWEQRVEVPSRVTYKRAPPQVLKAAADKLEKLMAGGAKSMTSKLLMVGPFAWDGLRKLPEFAKPTGLPVSWQFHVSEGDFALPGRAFRSKDDRRALLVADQAVRLWLSQDGPYKLRLLTAHELDTLWTLWPFDSIDEPIFLAESPKHKLVLNFQDGEVFFVDDFVDLSLAKIKALNSK